MNTYKYRFHTYLPQLNGERFFDLIFTAESQEAASAELYKAVSAASDEGKTLIPPHYRVEVLHDDDKIENDLDYRMALKK